MDRNRSVHHRSACASGPSVEGLHGSAIAFVTAQAGSRSQIDGIRISNLHAANVPDSVVMSISNHETPPSSSATASATRAHSARALEQVETLLLGLGTVPTVRPLAGER